jgi:hypothetical protein
MKTEGSAKSLAPLIPSSPVSEVVKSTSMSLIDDTANRLYDSMTSLPQTSISEDYAEGIAVVDATCKLADQIHKLLRLKLDVLKHAQKGSKA